MRARRDLVAVWLVLALAQPWPKEVQCITSKCFTFFNPKFAIKCQGDFPWPPFPQMSQLTGLFVNGPCPFQLITRDNFTGLDQLQQLVISLISSLQLEDDNLGPINRSLKYLSISNCDLITIPNDFFCHLDHLRVVDLSFNAIIDIDSLGFGHTSICNSSISFVDISYNNISHLPSRLTVCQSLQRLDYLKLSANVIQSIDDHAFVECTNLQRLDLSDNNLTSFPIAVAKDLTNIDHLSFGGNRHLRVDNQFLHWTPNLKHLQLNDIGLVDEDLQNDTFIFNTKLEKLYLDGNQLTDINSEVLSPLAGSRKPITGPCNDRPMNGLDLLSLNRNRFNKLPTSINLLVNLRRLSITENQIGALTSEDFSNLTWLFQLELSKNRIETISSNVFQTLVCLSNIDLSRNRISHFESGVFDSNSELIRIDLSNNRLKSIDGLFPKSDYSLLTLDLSYNNLSNVSLNSLPLSLAIVNLSHNSLQTLGEEFPEHVHMTTLDLSHNFLKRIRKEDLPVSLINLYMNNNRLESMDYCTFCTTSRIETITMHNNSLRSIQLRWLFTIDDNTKSTITLAGNPLMCDCEVGHFQRHIDLKHIPKTLDIKSITCQRVYDEHSWESFVQMWRRSYALDFLCEVQSSPSFEMPPGCTTYSYVNKAVVVANCTNANLTVIPTNFPNTIYIWHFIGNHLITINNDSFRHWPGVRRIYLDNNRIETIEDNSFLVTPNLTVLSLENNLLEVITSQTFSGLSLLAKLYLSYNRLSRIDDNAFLPLRRLDKLTMINNSLVSFPVWNLKLNKAMAKFDIYNNPWSCDCSYLEKFRKFLQEFRRARKSSNITCQLSPNETAAITSFNMTRYCYNTPTFVQSKYFVLLIALLTTTVTLVVICVAGYAYRKEMQIIVYSRYGVRLFGNRDREDDGRIFDAFVAYCNDDEDFLVEDFLPGLRNIDNPYYLCLHHTHFIVGAPIADNIRAAVSKSRRTIMLLSDKFIRSEWCRYEFKMAYIQMLKDHCNRVIVVVIGDIPKDLEPEMKLYLKTNTYLVWGDKRFWPKIYFAMPEVPRKPPTDEYTEYTLLLSHME